MKKNAPSLLPYSNENENISADSQAHVCTPFLVMQNKTSNCQCSVMFEINNETKFVLNETKQKFITVNLQKYVEIKMKNISVLLPNKKFSLLLLFRGLLFYLIFLHLIYT